MTTTFQNVDVGRQCIEIKTKFLIMVANLTRIDAALISHNISRYAGVGIPQFDCITHSLQFDLRHWEAPPSRSLFRVTMFRSASLTPDFQPNPSTTLLSDFLDRKLKHVAVDQLAPFLNEIVKEFPRILELWLRVKWFICLPTFSEAYRSPLKSDR
jgi:hypothetical protein